MYLDFKVNSIMEKNKSNNNNYLAFNIDDKTLAVPLLSLQGAIGNPYIKPITNSPEFMVGTYYINSSYIPILDLRTILNKPDLIYPDKSCVIVVRVSFKGLDKPVGLVVDSFFSVQQILTTDIMKLPSFEDTEYIDGVSYQSDKMILHLNLERIINEKKVICFLNAFWNVNWQSNDTDSDMSKKNGV